MLTLRRVLVVLGGAWVCAWIVGALFRWVLDVDDTVGLVLTLAAAAFGGWASLDEARSVEPWTLWDKRDAYLGWVTFLGIVAAIGCLLLPLPWGVIAAGVVAALTIVVLRRAPPAPPRPPEPDLKSRESTQ